MGLKTSISLDRELLEAIDDYRAVVRPIPNKSDAIKVLLWRALRVKDAATDLPPGALRLEGLKIRIREPQREKGRGGSSLINLPFQRVREAFADRDPVDVIIIGKVKK